jgi:hypothetical protein
MDEPSKVTAQGEVGMKDIDFDALLIGSIPGKYSVNKRFSDNVMDTIHSSEILSSSIRKIDVNKKETFIMRFRHLPKIAIIAIAIGALLIISTGVYAAYQLLWPKPQVTVSQPTISTNGREEVSLSFSQCGNTHLADRYELKRNATITADQIAGVVTAQCELQAIDSWAHQAFPNDTLQGDPSRGDSTKPYDSTRVMTSMATHVKTVDESSVTFIGLTNYGQAGEVTVSANKNTRYIIGGVDATADKITTTDPVVYITSNTIHIVPSSDCTKMHCNSSGTTTASMLVAVVKLSMPFADYDQFAWQSLTEKQNCMGNEQDTCLSGSIGSIDLYMNTTDSNDVGGVIKEIRGVITKIDMDSVTIQGSSGDSFTIKSTTDIVGDYNTKRASQYNNQTVKVGSSLIVRYYEKDTEHSRLITTNLFSMGLQLEMVGKADLPNAY